MKRLRTRFTIAVTSVALAALFAAPALGHENFTTDRGHLEEDSVIHSAAVESRLAARTEVATTADASVAAAAVVGNEHQVGQWGPVVNWPVVGVHVALLPNGKVLAYDSVGDDATETYPVHTTPAPRSGIPRPARRRR